MAENTDVLGLYGNLLRQAYGGPDLPDLMQAMAQRPVLGANVHAQPQKSPAWIAEQTIEPVAFGSFADPVSQLAFLAAPGALRGVKGLLETAGSPGPRVGGVMASERGNLGPVPRGPGGQALPESRARTPEGALQRLYHGTNRVYPDFEVSQYGSGAGGDLYGPGIYMTENPGIAGRYSMVGQASPSVEHTVAYMERVREMRGLVAEARAAGNEGLAQTREGLARAYEQELERLMSGSPPNIRPVYADVKKPFDMEARIAEPEAQRLLEKLFGRGAREVTEIPERYRARNWPEESLKGEELYRGLVQRYGGNKAAVNRDLRALGYDGITHIGGGVTGGQPHRVYIAFHPDQVYPAANVEALGH